MDGQEKYVAYVGTYTHGSSIGIHVYDIDIEAGIMTEREVIPVNNASHMTKSYNGKYLYSIADEGVEVLAIKPDGGLEPINKVGIDGVVLTKLDGDTRGGAALSIRAVSGKPILYVGMGEKLSDLEQFYPDRMASRILGMGDVMSLIEKAQANIDEEKAKAMEQKMKKAQFDFNDYLDSMEQMRNMGGISSILNMLPGVGAKMKGQDLESMVDEKDMARKEAIVLSMTPKERENPDLINPSRKQRIAKGAGVDIAEVNRFIKQFEQSRKMMKQMTGMVGKGGKRGGFKLPF